MSVYRLICRHCNIPLEYKSSAKAFICTRCGMVCEIYLKKEVPGTEAAIFNFGKYKDEPITSVPSSYLEWLVENAVTRPIGKKPADVMARNELSCRNLGEEKRARPSRTTRPQKSSVYMNYSPDYVEEYDSVESDDINTELQREISEIGNFADPDE